MPLRIIRDFTDPAHTRRVVYVPDRTAQPSTRPRGNMGINSETGWPFPKPKPAPPTRYLGLDLGQAADYTALALVERAASGYNVVMLERVRDLPYTTLVARVAELMDTPELAGSTALVVDATGCGRPVIDMIRGAGLSPIAVTIHGGAKVTGGRLAPRVPKADLINGLLVAMQAGAIHISDQLAHTETLAHELAEMRRKVSVSGHASYGCWRDGEHDDLILALAIALWAAERAVR